ncbi:MAG: four helix bundle protein [Melioribacter sp.]|nr:four helix bundle protein [Melioribacter sp.]
MIENKIKSFEDLEIWRLSHSLVLEIYRIVKSFPKSENYILTKQIIRYAQSIPANIAEGMGRYSKNELVQFLIIARGSVEETKYHLILARDLEYIDSNTFENMQSNYTLLGKKINSLVSSIKTK